MKRNSNILLLLVCLVLAGCAVNPVTGKRQLSLISPEQEVQLGTTNYLPSQQSQGGIYYLDPTLTQYVQHIGHKLAKQSDRPELPYEFVILNNSVPNAWALPGGKIAINRGLLLELNDESQLAAVLGHEIVHAAARHGANKMTQSMIMGTGVQLVSIAAERQGMGDWVTTGANIGASLIQTKYGRDQELESDHYGMTYMSQAGYDPYGAVKLQETFLRLSANRQTNWLEGLFASHPPSSERLKANRTYAAQLPQGFIGYDTYQARIAQLKRDAPAYKAYDIGVKALQNKNASAALKQANAAIKIQPQEGLFHELKGRALQVQQKNKAALAAYDLAIQYNPNYFSHFLSRALLHKAMGNTAGAKKDLARSNQLLPTHIAKYAEGELALANNDKKTALQLFSAVGKADTPIGKSARRQMAKLELSTHPDKYIKAKLTRSPRGELVVAAENHSEVDVKEISIVIINTNIKTKQSIEKLVKIPNIVKAQQRSAMFGTGLKVPGAAGSLYAKVIAARML